MEVNRQLSQRRAEMVRDYLISEGSGGDKPVADNATPEERAANHRVALPRLQS